jgi:hypothetical protein
MLARLRAAHEELEDHLPGAPPEEQMIDYLTTQ